MPKARVTGTVLANQVEVATLRQAADEILAMAALHRPAYVTFATAYMLVKALRDKAIHRAYTEAAMVTPDGMPVAWCLRSLGYTGVECISGPRLVPLLLRDAAERGIVVGFYGGRDETLDLMREALQRALPALKIGYICSPPFRSLSLQEQQPFLDNIRSASVELLFIGLGSPKQDLWMHDYGGSLPCVCLGVGAAFEFLSGEKVLPPFWVQRLGLTWLIRLYQEPRRLIVRNLYSPVFVCLFLLQRIFRVDFERRFTEEMVSEAPSE